MFSYKRKEKKARLSIAPLLDMIFILLIFFVVSTTFNKTPGIEINKPDARYAEKLPPNNLMIGVSKDGFFYVNKNLYEEDQLFELINKKAKSINNLSVVIVADEDSAIKKTVKVMDLCEQAGVDNIAIAEELTR
jgi:biopolymer transport protein ExbD